MSNRTVKPRWSKSSSSLLYTPAQVQSLTPVRDVIENRAARQPDLRDVFLCHAWGDRKEAAKELYDLLEAADVKVWFSEKDLSLGVPMMRAIDKGLANSRIGLVLVTPAMLERLPKESVADKELSTLLAGNQLIPIIHNTSYEALRDVSPMLASRSGLDTNEDSMKIVAEKIAELVKI
ncbi:toll/interleukin-1 receptor domain-containing protein [Psychrobacter sp. 16-MNA-CIBAN-0192]|uniref:toll/interleukin-1 receptor domain-containing protein n=1 Tax=Psychrobacter sp. 16-MNA-CIBAN-0192 TaxID=3140448 RepID=UPI00332673F1